MTLNVGVMQHNVFALMERRKFLDESPRLSNRRLMISSSIPLSNLNNQHQQDIVDADC
jgi:hypothetical protein